MDEEPRSLSTSELQQLIEIEDELERDDPELAAILSSAAHRRRRRFWSAPRAKRMALGAALTVGAAALIVGIIVGAPVVGAVGFVSIVISADAVLADDQVVRRVLRLIGVQRDDRNAGP